MNFNFLCLFCISLFCHIEVESSEFNTTDLGNKWYQHEQFGAFYDANQSGWYYHLDHGWIYVDEWDDNGTWMYMANENTSQNTYFHNDGNQYNLITDWEEIADSTGLSLEFLQAVTTASGNDINFTNANEQDVHVSDVVMPFGWVWTSSSTRDFLYNNYLDEWLYFSRKIKDSDYRYYSYKTKSYINNKEIHELEYSPDIWREALAGFGFDVYLNLDGLDQIKDLNESHENIFGGNAGKLRIKIPKEQIDEDNFWSPLVSNLEQFDNLSNGELFKLLQIDENQESVTITVRTLFHSINVAEKVNSISLLGVDDRRQASAKGLDDHSSKEAIALEKVGLIDLDDENPKEEIGRYIEVAKVASDRFSNRDSRERLTKSDSDFISDIINNFDNVTNIISKAETLGLKDDAMVIKLLDESQNASDLNEVVEVVSEFEIDDSSTLSAIFRTPENADDIREIIEISSDYGLKNKDNLYKVFKNADKADSLKEVVTRTIDLNQTIKESDKNSLKNLLSNADRLDDIVQTLKLLEHDSDSDILIQQLEFDSNASIFVNNDGWKNKEEIYITIEGSSLSFSGDTNISSLTNVILESIADSNISSLTFEDLPLVSDGN